MGSEIISDTKVKDLFVYKSYLHSVQYDKVDKLQLWYNKSPGGQRSQLYDLSDQSLTTHP